MMSPEEIFDKKFEKGRGYDKKEVDDYLQELYQAYKDLYTPDKAPVDNHPLPSYQIRTLNNGLQHYKTIETSLQKALILAEKTADETIQTAKLKADSIIREAENRAATYTSDSKAELEAVHGKTIGLMQEYVRYKAQFNKLIQDQIELLNGSRFEIQTEDLLAFQKLSEEESNNTAASLADTMPIPEAESNNIIENDGNEAAATVSFGATSESNINYESLDGNQETVSYEANNSTMNNLDYLNAAERFNEETLQHSVE